MKYIKWIVLTLVAVVVLAVVVVVLNLDGIVRSTVQTQASSSLNVPTTLGSASISLLGGKVSLGDLKIGSPPGFSAPQMLTLDATKVQVSYGQLRKEPIHIDQITLDAPKLVIEQSGGKLNFNALMDQPSSAPPSGGEPMKLIIDQLAVNNAQVSLRPGIPGLAAEIAIAIPSVSLQNLGSGEGNHNGVAMKEVVMQVVTAIASKAAESDKLPPEVRALLSGNLKQVADKLVNEQLKKATAGLEKQLGGVLSNPQGATSNPSPAIEKGLGGLLGGSGSKKK